MRGTQQHSEWCILPPQQHTFSFLIFNSSKYFLKVYIFCLVLFNSILFIPTWTKYSQTLWCTAAESVHCQWICCSLASGFLLYCDFNLCSRRVHSFSVDVKVSTLQVFLLSSSQHQEETSLLLFSLSTLLLCRKATLSALIWLVNLIRLVWSNPNTLYTIYCTMLDCSYFTVCNKVQYMFCMNVFIIIS